MDTITFEPFPKLGRWSRKVIITEKIDGTNAQVIITEDGQIGAASRTRLIFPGKDTDNFGFAAWVQDNREELLKLGPGRHFGEWFGQGIQSGYGLKERRFALFNVNRWNPYNPPPACCTVVPVLDEISGEADVGTSIKGSMDALALLGSQMVPGFMNPEGVVIFHTATGSLFKKTFAGDAEGKDRAGIARA
jgi:hypothetical protein